RLREDVHVEAADLIAIDSLDAKPTYNGLVNAVQVGIRYIEAWLRGLGAVAIFNLMEDAATAEISRSQIWQWINAGVEFEHAGKPPSRRSQTASSSTRTTNTPPVPGFSASSVSSASKVVSSSCASQAARGSQRHWVQYSISTRPLIRGAPPHPVRPRACRAG